MWNNNAFLGQVPLVLGPSSWGATIPFASEAPARSAAGTPPFYIKMQGGGLQGSVGPFESVEAASQLARAALLELDPGLSPPGGFQVVDAAGRTVATVT